MGDAAPSGFGFVLWVSLCARPHLRMRSGESVQCGTFQICRHPEREGSKGTLINGWLYMYWSHLSILNGSFVHAGDHVPDSLDCLEKV